MANHKRFLIPCDIGASIVVELANLRPLTLPEQKMLALELGESSDSWLAFNADIAWSDDIARTRFGSQLIGAIDTHRGTLVIWG
jgi:hypothetical protein